MKTPCLTDDLFFEFCELAGVSRQEAEACIVSREGIVVCVDTQHPFYPKSITRPKPELQASVAAQPKSRTRKAAKARSSRGPGGYLKAMLRSLGITASSACSCNARAAEMDRKGCDWCEENIDTIIGWLREEATKRRLPFLDAAGRLLVKRAIHKARRDAS